ncbi:DUF2637 domain-containing protein [Micromonospora sp. A3M-1-15]|uniref:DUF2637 domain-containing protein n=1 Tax=Micromonospora sp. A3M-1-15 TaxID=2962035 RepID=UPI0020B6EDB1|nr:DUF2637 domain-containing protein [Micromonospora sp. A3M-1-15]MCP3785265.1 DUF2637 domain-containing protein [Micromonospora sp. A3M-1-15]
MTVNTTLTSSSDNSPDALTGDATDQLQRLRWAVRASLALGVVASVAANVLHARPNPISQIIAAWPPLALLLTVELISRAPHHRRLLRAIRLAATAVIAAIATWVSYWHLVGVAARYGETEHGAAYLLPISVDGLVIVASVSLVEITARIHAATLGKALVTPPTAPPLAEQSPATTVTRSTRTRVPRGATHHDPAQDTPPTRPSEASQPGSTDNNGASRPALPHAAPDTNPDDVPADTAPAVAYWRRRDPTLHPAEIAARIGRSERTVRRHWPSPGKQRLQQTSTAPR